MQSCATRPCIWPWLSCPRFARCLPVITVSVRALRQHDAEADADIAYALGESAWLPLDAESERAESIPQSYAGKLVIEQVD